MKLSKKVLAAMSASALLLTAGIFTSCGEDDDDENEMLSGSNNDYSISYTNDSDSVSRGYKTTTFKHAGSLCQITMNKSDAGAGAMGYIWDLESNSSRAEKDPRRFFIVGFNYDQTASGKVAYYLSRYTNVTDISLNNFGATATSEKETGSTATSTGATEKEYIALKAANSCTPTADADGNFVITVDVYEGGEFTVNSETGKKTYTAYDGSYIVDIYNGKVEEVALKGTTTNTEPVATYTIPATDVGYLTDGTTSTSKVCGSSANQKNGAVYANVYAGKTLTGSWHYAETYSAAEAVEE
ncbi:MAG: hypothetical protein IJ673_13495 [Treponema sp.]|nr:hypothetical protein [Treponema sp.]